MRTVIPLEMATFEALSQEERTQFYRDAIRSAHQARSNAVRTLFRAMAERFERQPLLTRALVDSAAILAMVIALSAAVSAPVSARMASVSAMSDHRIDVTPRIPPYSQAKKAIYCNGIDGAERQYKGC